MAAVAIWGFSWSWRRGTSRGRFLTVALEHFDETGEWPRLGLVQRRLTRFLDPSNARRTAKRLPAALGRVEGERLVLSVRGIRLVEPNHPILEDFERVLAWASRHYRHDDGLSETVISGQDLITGMGFTEQRAQRVMALVAAERLGLLRSEAALLVTSAIVPYLYVRDADEYLETRHRRELLQGARRFAGFLGSAVSWLSGRPLVQRIAAGVIVGLVTALLIAVITGHFPPSSSGSVDHIIRKSSAARSGG